MAPPSRLYTWTLRGARRLTRTYLELLGLTGTAEPIVHVDAARGQATYSDLLGVTRSYSDLLGVTRSYSDLLGVTRTYWDLIGVIRSYSILIGPNGTYLASPSPRYDEISHGSTV